jgi:crotonobetainyl-CoA:carnitine CoA-transferase CaiB-like acyl-CoA transferase
VRKLESGGPLSGVRVLDFTALISGPGTTVILADQGAEVIKIEPPGGDIVRFASPNKLGLSGPFIAMNRGKRSLAVDLKTEAGRAIVHRLLPTTDVVIQNFRPGAFERMGFSAQAIRATYPEVIVLGISGFGEYGPKSAARVYDPLVQAMCGMASLQRQTLDDPPQVVRTIVPDTVVGFAAAQAITAALLARAKGRGGQTIDLSMLGVMISFMWPSSMANHMFIDWKHGEGTLPPMQNVVFPTTDGRFVAINILSDHEWSGFCRALGAADLMKQERFAEAKRRQLSSVELREAIAALVKNYEADELLQALEREDVPCAPVLASSEIFANEQVRANRIVHEADLPEIGRVRQANHWARFQTTPAKPPGAAPLLGGDTRKILAEIGYTEAQIGMQRQSWA